MSAPTSRKQQDEDARDVLVGIVYGSLVELAGGTASEDAWHNELRRLAEATVHYTTVQDVDKSGKPWNIEIRTAPAFYNRYKQQTQPNDGWMLSVTSPFGVERPYASAPDLGNALLVIIETACRHQEDLIDSTDRAEFHHHIRLQRPSGIVCLATPDRMRYLLSHAPPRQPCPHCPLWYKGEQGLRWHVQHKHHSQYELAKRDSSSGVDQALVVYRARPSTEQKGGSLCKEVSVAPHNVTSDEDNDDPWEQVKSGDLVGLKRNIATGRFDPSSAVDSKGASPLLWAAGGGHVSMVEYLVKETACDANFAQKGQRAFSGRTALHWAARNGHVSVVQFLLDLCHGVDGCVEVNATTADGTSAFHWAAWQGHVDIMQMLLRSPGVETVNPMAAHTNSYGCNAALWAAQGNGTPAILEWLQSVGCPLYVVNHSGHGILHKAAQRGRRDICEWFAQQALRNAQRCKASTDDKLDLLSLIGPDNDGCLPSDLAGMEEHEELALFLTQQERALMECALDLEDPVPTWFSRAAVPSDARIWEPWAGVARLRHACQYSAEARS